MKILLTILTMLIPGTAIPEQLDYKWWLPENFGAPCTTLTDIIEGTCKIEVNSKPDWSKN